MSDSVELGFLLSSLACYSASFGTCWDPHRRTLKPEGSSLAHSPPTREDANHFRNSSPREVGLCLDSLALTVSSYCKGNSFTDCYLSVSVLVWCSKNQSYFPAPVPLSHPSANTSSPDSGTRAIDTPAPILLCNLSCLLPAESQSILVWGYMDLFNSSPTEIIGKDLRKTHLRVFSPDEMDYHLHIFPEELLNNESQQQISPEDTRVLGPAPPPCPEH